MLTFFVDCLVLSQKRNLQEYLYIQSHNPDVIVKKDFDVTIKDVTNESCLFKNSTNSKRIKFIFNTANKVVQNKIIKNTFVVKHTNKKDIDIYSDIPIPIITCTFWYINIFHEITKIFTWLILLFIYKKMNTEIKKQEVPKQIINNLKLLLSLITNIINICPNNFDIKYLSINKNIQYNINPLNIDEKELKNNDDLIITEETGEMKPLISDTEIKFNNAYKSIMKNDVIKNIWNSKNFCKNCYELKHDDNVFCKHRCSFCKGNHDKCCINKLHCNWCGKLKGSHTCNNGYTKFYKRNIRCPTCNITGHFGLNCNALYLAMKDVFGTKIIYVKRPLKIRNNRRGIYYALFRRTKNYRK